MPDPSVTSRSVPTSPIATPLAEQSAEGVPLIWRLREAAGQPHPPRLLIEAADSIEQAQKALWVAHSAVGILYEKAIGDEPRAVIQTVLDLIEEASSIGDAGAHDVATAAGGPCLLPTGGAEPNE